MIFHTTRFISRSRGKTCLVVGGGNVGLRKAHTLLKSGAQVNLVSPRITAEHSHHIMDKITWIPAPYGSGHLKGIHLVFAATHQAEQNRQIARRCKKSRHSVQPLPTIPMPRILFCPPLFTGEILSSPCQPQGPARPLPKNCVGIWRRSSAPNMLIFYFSWAGSAIDYWQKDMTRKSTESSFPP